MSLNQITFQDFLKVEIYSGTIVRVERFPEARKPAYKLWVDFGPKLGVKTASAKLTGLYDPEHLVGKQVVGVVNFSPRQVANFVSEVLLLGVSDKNGQVVLLQPERRVPNGERAF